jgi:hypothetical protein
MGHSDLTDGAAGVRSLRADRGHGRVWSTGHLAIVFLAAFLLLIGFPALIWMLGIVFAQ